MPARFLAMHADRSYALLRIFAGAMFSFHGVQKILGMFTDHQPPVGSQIWVGGLIELVGGIAIALGVCTSWAAFVASGMMAVAYTQFHWKLRFDSGILPGVNQGELALLYAWVFLLFACRGSGIWSVDALRKSKSS